MTVTHLNSTVPESIKLPAFHYGATSDGFVTHCSKYEKAFNYLKNLKVLCGKRKYTVYMNIYYLDHLP